MRQPTLSHARRLVSAAFIGLYLLTLLAISAMWIRSCWCTDVLEHWTRPPESMVWPYDNISCWMIASTSGRDKSGNWISTSPAIEIATYNETGPEPFKHQAQWSRPLRGEWTLYGNVDDSAYTFLDARYDHFFYSESFIRHPIIHLTWRRSVFIPYYWLVALLITWPLTRWTVSTFRRRRKRAGRCAMCGYDLRATPTRCPECGAAPV